MLKMSTGIGIGIVVVVVVLSICLLVANLVAGTSILTRCYGLSFTVGLLLLLIPGLNIVGLLLMAIAGMMLLLGKCKHVHLYNKPEDIDCLKKQ